MSVYEIEDDYLLFNACNHLLDEDDLFAGLFVETA